MYSKSDIKNSKEIDLDLYTINVKNSYKNIIVMGKTGSGKSSFLRSCFPGGNFKVGNKEEGVTKMIVHDTCRFRFD